MKHHKLRVGIHQERQSSRFVQMYKVKAIESIHLDGTHKHKLELLELLEYVTFSLLESVLLLDSMLVRTASGDSSRFWNVSCIKTPYYHPLSIKKFLEFDREVLHPLSHPFLNMISLYLEDVSPCVVRFKRWFTSARRRVGFASGVSPLS